MSTAAPQRSSHKLSQHRLPFILAMLGWTLIIVFTLIEILPFGLAAANSFKCLGAVRDFPRALIPIPPFGVQCENKEGQQISTDKTATATTFHPTLDGYKKMWDTKMPRWVFNTAFIAISVTLFRLFFDSLAGYALARLRFRGNRLLFFVVLATMMLPPIVLVIPRFIILKNLGMLNSYMGLIFPAVVDAFGVFMMKQFFETFPKETEEAAMVNGASRITVFTKIVLPVSTPSLVALAIFSFQSIWNDFLTPLVIVGSTPDMWTLPVGLSFLRGVYGQTHEWNAFLAGSMLTLLPLAAAFLVFQRRFMANIGYTGLKM